MRAVLALIVLLAFAVAPVRALDGRRLRLHGGRLVDERRREVTLRGVNARVEGVFDVTFDDGRASSTSPSTTAASRSSRSPSSTTATRPRWRASA